MLRIKEELEMPGNETMAENEEQFSARVVRAMARIGDKKTKK